MKKTHIYKGGREGKFCFRHAAAPRHAPLCLLYCARLRLPHTAVHRIPRALLYQRAQTCARNARTFLLRPSAWVARLPEARSVCKALPTSALVRAPHIAFNAPRAPRLPLHVPSCTSVRVATPAWVTCVPFLSHAFSPTMYTPPHARPTAVVSPPSAPPPPHRPLVRSPPPACYAKLRPPPPLRVHAHLVPETQRRDVAPRRRSSEPPQHCRRTRTPTPGGASLLAGLPISAHANTT